MPRFEVMNFYTVRSGDESALHVCGLLIFFRRSARSLSNRAREERATQSGKQRNSDWSQKFQCWIASADTVPIFRTGFLGDSYFFVDAEDVSHSVTNFAERGVGFYRLVNVRHGVFRARCGFAQRSEAAGDLIV
jgi:hypothetical protein